MVFSICFSLHSLFTCLHKRNRGKGKFIWFFVQSVPTDDVQVGVGLLLHFEYNERSLTLPAVKLVLYMFFGRGGDRRGCATIVSYPNIPAILILLINVDLWFHSTPSIPSTQKSITKLQPQPIKFSWKSSTSWLRVYPKPSTQNWSIDAASR